MRSVVCKEGNRGWWVSSLLILYVLGYFNGNQEILVTITLFDQYLTVDMTYSPQKELSKLIEGNEFEHSRVETDHQFRIPLNVSEYHESYDDYEDFIKPKSTLSTSSSSSSSSSFLLSENEELMTWTIQRSKWQKLNTSRRLQTVYTPPDPSPFDVTDLDYSSFEKGGSVFMYENNGWKSQDNSLPYTSPPYRRYANLDPNMVIRNDDGLNCYPVPTSNGAITLQLADGGGPIIARQFHLKMQVFSSDSASDLGSFTDDILDSDSISHVNFSIYGWTSVLERGEPGFGGLRARGERIELGTFAFNIHKSHAFTQVPQQKVLSYFCSIHHCILPLMILFSASFHFIANRYFICDTKQRAYELSVLF